MLLRGFGILLLDDLGERRPDIILACPQEPHQARDEHIVDPLRLAAPFFSLLARDAKALRGRMLAVPLERVGARKEIPAVVAEVDLQWVQLLRVAVPLEVIPRLECRIRTASALDLANRATFPVGLGGCEQRLVPWLENIRELEVLMHHFLLLLLLLLLPSLLHRFLHPTPLNPNQLSVHNLFLSPLLETWSLQGSTVNSLCVRGRGHLRSSSRLLGFTVDLLFWDPGHRLVAGPSSGLRCLQDPLCLAAPASFLGPPLVMVDLGPDTLWLFPTAFTKAQDRRRCCRCLRSEPENLADVPFRCGSADTSISDAGCVNTAHKGYSRRRPIKRRAVSRHNRPLFVATARRRRGCGKHELPYLKEPGQFMGRRRSWGTARVHNLLKESR